MNISLTSSSGGGQNEPFRIARLEKVSRIYKFQVGDLSEQKIPEIISLHDHKGKLAVSWNREPNEEQKNVIKLVWELQNEYDIIHNIDGEL
ncbi:hypothetical protein A8C32_11150 [Flavivirga aquatica]|uniref:Uncharacterized protein n=1 Tax=Flavivirga aquatica TaxID=1849968 RepID=A0A1E5TD15_9FLAO|nr:hypothetical protein [Flavivirga aquatica]OEK09273.1 hypothetical protein A8C32_11150 [Flavivirga aquatica]